MSSSSPTSSVPPLPAELILHILHLAYPPHAEDDYCGRAQDVLQCSLVSKQWNELAEPVLWRSVSITPATDLDSLAAVPESKRRLTRNLAFGNTRNDGSDGLPVRPALYLFPLVEHVRLSGIWDNEDRSIGLFRLSDFQSLPEIAFDEAILPRLQSLRLEDQILPDALPLFLNKTSTPSLRHLVFTDAHDPDKSSFLLKPGFYTDMLDTLEVDTCLIEANKEIFHHDHSNVLLSFYEVSLMFPDRCAALKARFPYPPRHLRLDTLNDYSWTLLQNLFLLPHRPESLFLPRLPPAYVAGSEVDELARQAFLKRCKDEGIEVRYYRRGCEWRQLGCEEFRKYIAERNAGKGEKEGEEEE
ncbi:hypothetical protein JCM8097_005733 [Rhodosporidiobolus ruineniae]